MENVIDLLGAKGIGPKKASSTNGGEYHSPCPDCGDFSKPDSDRFHVWPAQNSGSGSYWCRGCGKRGDSIQFLIDFNGLTYPEACAYLDVPASKRQKFRPPRIQAAVRKKDAFEPSDPDLPPSLWMEKAEAFVSWAHDNLLSDREQLRWLKKRGIKKETAVRFKLGWNPVDRWRPRSNWGLPDEKKDNGKLKKLWFPPGLVIPAFNIENIVRIRIRRPEGTPRYYLIPGSTMSMMILQPVSRAITVIESELDTILVDQEAGDITGTLALGSSSLKPDRFVTVALKHAAVILMAHDYDAAGAKATTWWFDHYPQAERWPVPQGKDPGEAYQNGVDIRAWISAGLPSAWNTGPFVLDSRKSRGGANSKGQDGGGGEVSAPVEKDGKEAVVGSKGSDRGRGKADPAVAVPGLIELAERLRESPVSIHNTPNRLAIIESNRWARRNWETSKRISHLVYMDPEVFKYLLAHPAEKITGRNLRVVKI